MKVFTRIRKRIRIYLKVSTTDAREAIKSAFRDDFGEKDVELIVNGLAKKLTPELQSTLVLSLIKYRNQEIHETENKLEVLKEDRDRLLANIIIASNS